MVQAGMKECQVESGLWETEVFECHTFFTAVLSLKAKHAVKLSITDLKITRK